MSGECSSPIATAWYVADGQASIQCSASVFASYPLVQLSTMRSDGRTQQALRDAEHLSCGAGWRDWLRSGATATDIN